VGFNGDENWKGPKTLKLGEGGQGLVPANSTAFAGFVPGTQCSWGGFYISYTGELGILAPGCMEGAVEKQVGRVTALFRSIQMVRPGCSKKLKAMCSLYLVT